MSIGAADKWRYKLDQSTRTGGTPPHLLSRSRGVVVTGRSRDLSLVGHVS
jgi:hypothetical protein